MTSPRTRHPGTQLWQFDDGPAIDQHTLVVLAGGVWAVLLLIGLLLTFH